LELTQPILSIVEEPMRYLLLSGLAVCAAALLVMSGCSDGTAPPVAPEEASMQANEGMNCGPRHMKLEFVGVPYQEDFRGWVPDNAIPDGWTGPGDPRLRVYHLMDADALRHQDTTAAYRGVAFLTNTKGNSWEMRLRMIMNGYQDIWGLYYWGNARGNVLPLNGKFRMDGSGGIFHHITGLVDVRGEARLDSHATWQVDHVLETCGHPTPGPAAWFTVLGCDETQTCSFFNTDMAGRDTRANNVDFHWAFGDGTQSYGQNPVHAFAEPGVYDVVMTVKLKDPVSLVVTDHEASRTISVTVGDPEIPDPPQQPPFTADFTFNCGNSDTCSFQDASAGTVVGWAWEFENASPTESTDQNPRGIRFLRYGSHKVTLEVVSAVGERATISRTVGCRVLGNRLRCG
jgi:hypothetical protein